MKFFKNFSFENFLTSYWIDQISFLTPLKLKRFSLIKNVTKMSGHHCLNFWSDPILYFTWPENRNWTQRKTRNKIIKITILEKIHFRKISFSKKCFFVINRRYWIFENFGPNGKPKFSKIDGFLKIIKNT